MAIIILHVCTWQWFWQSYCCTCSTHGTSSQIQSHFEHVIHKMLETCGISQCSSDFWLGSLTAIAQSNGITTGKSTHRHLWNEISLRHHQRLPPAAHLCKGHLQTTNASQQSWRTHGRNSTGKEEIGTYFSCCSVRCPTLFDIVFFWWSF